MRILVTRPEPDASATAEKIALLGHEAIISPAIKIRFISEISITPSEDDLVIFTSLNGARGLAELISYRNLKILCVGKATVSEAKKCGFLNADYVPETYGGNAHGMAEYLRKTENKIILHYGGSFSDIDLKIHPNYVFQQVYETLPIEEPTSQALNLIRNSELDFVTFFSPKSGEIFMNWAKSIGFLEKLLDINALTISIATSQMIGNGWKSVKTAKNPDQESLLALIPAKNHIFS
jgi:uroporphyrinogen-III synthase